jgi:Transposase IS200 like
MKTQHTKHVTYKLDYHFVWCPKYRKRMFTGQITVTHLLRLVAIPDEQEYYQLDDGQDSSAFQEGVDEVVGVLIGYLGGPLHPEMPEEQQDRADGVYVAVMPETVPVG